MSNTPQEPTAKEEIDAIAKTLESIRQMPLEARIRVLRFAWSWATDPRTQPVVKVEEAKP